MKSRQPLSNNEMLEILTDLMKSENFNSDQDRWQYLQGMKVGIITAGVGIGKEEALRLTQAVNLFQEIYKKSINQ